MCSAKLSGSAMRVHDAGPRCGSTMWVHDVGPRCGSTMWIHEAGRRKRLALVALAIRGVSVP